MDSEFILCPQQSVEMQGAVRRNVSKPHAGRFLKWLVSGGTIGGIYREMFLPMIIITLPTTPFDPADFPGLGQGWMLVEGEEEDSRMLALDAVDTTRFRLETTLNEGESIIGEERIVRLKRDRHTNIRAGARLFLYYLSNTPRIPEGWRTNGVRIYFDGTILIGPDKGRYTLCLYWDGERWCWACCWLGLNRYTRDLSLLIAE